MSIRCSLGHQSYIDVYLPQSKVLIEQKGQDIDLFKKAKQSDGTELNPFEQARRYNEELPFSEKARWIVTCNFKTFLIYDMDRDLKGKDPIRLELTDLPTRLNELDFLKSFKTDKIIEEKALSIKAGELIGKLYDGLIKQYKDPKSDNTLKSLNKLCVRLVFCLYAEDAGLFDRNDCHIFGNYIKNTETKNLRRALIDLFEVLNQDPAKNERDPYLDEELARFPYVNGNLFKVVDPVTEENPNFTDDLKTLIVEECSETFDWADISPTIFGAIFESTLNPETRRSGGMHYTSIENIHKVIDPLFLDDLKAEFARIKELKTEKAIVSNCDKFQNKLASLKFLDPACGSGNFLTETYLCLRRLENELILFRSMGMSTLSLEELNPVKVSLSQFYGIEINDFACAVATTALWIAESQMLLETEKIIHRDIDFLPLKSNHNIFEGNALRMDWNDVVPSDELNYIMGNPPFNGAMTIKDKRSDLEVAFPECEKIGEIDFVCGWYAKTAKYIIDNKIIHAAFVSTNSICQGQSVSFVWKPLINKLNLRIDFAWRTFVWDSEANEKAHVHCVIVGVSSKNSKSVPSLKIYNGLNSVTQAKHINPYLLDGDDVFIDPRKSPICDVSPMKFGSMPRDGGAFIIDKDQYKELQNDQVAQRFVKKYLGAEEFINRKERFCLWLKGVSPSEINKSPFIKDRVQKCRNFRLASKAEATRRLANTAYLFAQIAQPEEGNYLMVPRVSSERREYVPVGYLSADVIASDAALIIPNASLFELGVITSSTHMAWMRAVAGRLKSDYRYSKDVVYNNFIWSDVTDAQKEKISKTAQGILDARALYPDSSLADLYDPLTMPIELRKAHQANDKAVIEAYGWKKDITEEEIVAKLMQLYAEKTRKSA